MKAVILAGGLGLRLRPFTFSVPKPLLPIGEKPILEVIINRLKKFGFSDFLLAVGYKSKMVEAYFGDGGDFGVRIRYLREKNFSGTAGPLALLRDGFNIGRNESILLMNGDIMTQLNFSRMALRHKEKKYEITMGVKTIEDRKPYGFVEVKSGLVRRISEKPVFSRVINAGIYILNSSAIRDVPRGKFFTMPDLINSLIAQGRAVGAYDIKEYWLGLEELQHFEEVLNNKKIRKALKI